MAGAVKAIIATQFDPTGLNKAIGEFNKLGKSVRNVLGAVGITASFAGFTSALRDASKAAISDVKSQALLANQLKNTIGATDSAIASNEEFIKSLMLSTSIADDQLRPALATLVRATGDLGSAQSLLALSTDVAAGTGLGLETVAKAVGKAVNGQSTALKKLGIVVKEGQDPIKVLSDSFSGAAQAAANNDPYQQLNVIMGELSESVGVALLPSLQNLSGWLADPGTQSAIQFLIDKFNEFVTSLQNVVTGVNYVGQALANVLNIDPGFATKAWNGFFNGLQESALKILFGPAYPLFKLLGIVGGAAPANAKATFTQTTFTPTIFTPTTTGKSGSKTTGKTPAQIAADKEQKAYEQALADLAKFQTDLKGMTEFAGLTTMSKEMGQFEQEVTNTFLDINKKIAEGLANKTIRSKGVEALKATLNSYNALLIENAKKRDAIIAKRSLAEALINDVKSALTGTGNLANLLDTQTKQVTSSVTKIVDGFTITTKQTVDEVIGAKGVVGRLKDVVAKTKAFAGQLKDLKAAGLSPDLFKQIVDAGPDVGGQLATEILSGGADSVKALNDTFKELETVSASVAEQTAVVMYNNGVEVAGGLVAGLLSQEQQLIDAAKTLADAFNAAYQSQIMQLSTAIEAPVVAKTPTVTPKVSTKSTTTVNKITVKASSTNTKATGQAVVAAINKYKAASGIKGNVNIGLF